MLGIFQRIKASFQNYLKRMAEENRKEFGGGVPDCCKVNRPSNNGPKK